MADIVLITHWTGGDVYPFIRMGRLLYKEGHKVTLFTHCVYEQKATEAGLSFVAIDTPEEYENISNDLHMLSDPIGNKEDYLRFHLTYHGCEQLLREVKLIEKVCSEDSIIIARYRSSISGQLVAEKNKLRFAPLILAPNYFSHMELHDQMFGSEFRREINRARDELQLEPITGWKAWLNSPNHILCGWPDWYAQPDETWPQSACHIGFLEETDDGKDNSNAQAELLSAYLEEAREKGKKIAIITGGSSRMVSGAFYLAAIEACVKAELFGILVTPYEEYVPENLPEEVKWVRHVELRELMKHVDIILHHGGMGTINEAIDAAIPQIVLPHLTDGPDNADRLVRLGVARKFPSKKWDALQIAEELRKALRDDTQNVCKKYQQLNLKTYEERRWNQVLGELKPYVFTRYSQQIIEVEEKHAFNGRYSREHLLDIIKKKQNNDREGKDEK